MSALRPDDAGRHLTPEDLRARVAHHERITGSMPAIRPPAAAAAPTRAAAPAMAAVPDDPRRVPLRTWLLLGLALVSFAFYVVQL